jgi:uncharacterized Fe-S cluster protein YjdI
MVCGYSIDVNIFLLLQRIGLLKSKSPVFKENKPYWLFPLQNLNVCNASKIKKECPSA